MPDMGLGTAAILGGSMVASSALPMLAGGGDFPSPGFSPAEQRILDIWPRIMRQLEEEFDDINRAVETARQTHLFSLGEFHRRMALFDAAVEKYTPEIHPDVEKTLKEEKDIMTERMLRSFGPGWETTTPGIQGSAEFADAAARARFTARKSGELTKLGLLQYGLSIPSQLFDLAAGGVDIHVPAMNAALAKGGLINQPLSVYGGLRQQQMQADMFNAAQSAAFMNQIGGTLGRFGSGAAAGGLGLFGPGVGAGQGGVLGVSGLATPFLIRQGLLGRAGAGAGAAEGAMGWSQFLGL